MRLPLFQFAKCSPALRRLPLVLCLAALVCLAGCSGKKEPKATVSGKVTYKGSDVAGDMFFVGEDGKEYPSPITKGAYKMSTAPPGKYKVLVKSLLGKQGALQANTGVGPLRDVGTKDSATMLNTATKDQSGGGVSAPPKYGYVKTTDLEYELKEGKHEKDFDLK